jgi:hypothetical protein
MRFDNDRLSGPTTVHGAGNEVAYSTALITRWTSRRSSDVRKTGPTSEGSMPKLSLERIVSMSSSRRTWRLRVTRSGSGPVATAP